ncbi:MAG: hypothetical protein U0892_23370 [Pirellulales bacterium]
MLTEPTSHGTVCDEEKSASSISGSIPSSWAPFQLADALDGLDQAEEAFEYLKKAADVPDLRASASFKLGELLEKQNRVTEAALGIPPSRTFPRSDSARRSTARREAADAELARTHEMFDSATRYVQMLRVVDPKNPRWQQMAEEISQAESGIASSS